MQFSYNNNYHSNIGAPHFELLWGEDGHRVMGRTEVVRRTTELIQQIRLRVQTTQSRQKSYADRCQSKLEFLVDDMVLLKVSP